MNQCIAWVGHKAEVYNVLIVARTISQVLKPKINLDLDQTLSESQAKNGNMFTLKSLWSIWCDNAEGPTQAVLCNQDILCLLMFFITIFCSDWRSVSTFFHMLNLFNDLFQLYLCGINGTRTIDLLRKSLRHSHEGGHVNLVQSVRMEE